MLLALALLAAQGEEYRCTDQSQTGYDADETIPAIAPPNLDDALPSLGSSPLPEATTVPEELEFEVPRYEIPIVLIVRSLLLHRHNRRDRKRPGKPFMALGGSRQSLSSASSCKPDTHEVLIAKALASPEQRSLCLPTWCAQATENLLWLGSRWANEKNGLTLYVSDRTRKKAL